MTLDEFLTDRKLTATAFAKQAGISQAHMSRLRQGDVTPSFHMMDKIREATGGSVMPNDWFEDAQ